MPGMGSPGRAHPRVLMAKSGLDGHWRGIQVVSRALRDGGFEVLLAGMVRADELASTAVQEDVDLIGLHVGGRVEIVERMLKALRDEGVDVPVIAGGVIPPHMARRLEAQGVRTFPPGSKLEDIVQTARAVTSGTHDQQQELE